MELDTVDFGVVAPDKLQELLREHVGAILSSSGWTADSNQPQFGLRLFWSEINGRFVYKTTFLASCSVQEVVQATQDFDSLSSFDPSILLADVVDRLSPMRTICRVTQSMPSIFSESRISFFVRLCFSEGEEHFVVDTSLKDDDARSAGEIALIHCACVLIRDAYEGSVVTIIHDVDQGGLTERFLGADVARSSILSRVEQIRAIHANKAQAVSSPRPVPTEDDVFLPLRFSKLADLQSSALRDEGDEFFAAVALTACASVTDWAMADDERPAMVRELRERNLTPKVRSRADADVTMTHVATRCSSRLREVVFRKLWGEGRALLDNRIAARRPQTPPSRHVRAELWRISEGSVFTSERDIRVLRRAFMWQTSAVLVERAENGEGCNVFVVRELSCGQTDVHFICFGEGVIGSDAQIAADSIQQGIGVDTLDGYCVMIDRTCGPTDFLDEVEGEEIDAALRYALGHVQSVVANLRVSARAEPAEDGGCAVM